MRSAVAARRERTTTTLRLAVLRRPSFVARAEERASGAPAPSTTGAISHVCEPVKEESARVRERIRGRYDNDATTLPSCAGLTRASIVFETLLPATNGRDSRAFTPVCDG
jgi:hypothetical protein